MEPLVTIVMKDDYTTLGDWSQKEIDWLLDHMDWSVQSLGDGFITVSFFVPVAE